ncbi:DUF4124 domain-containing protein [Pseudomonas berkeleyensis]|uniref:DUF4124 domain-containing protein n=1 Tax=Pseudomonas berkeleyensis TaxID=2726956 RepID=A0A7G5DTG1_9PSED|nr:DUF4124 domain-containing protein [Pseudomonas berkeleyensis]QMV65036.1 DUF4124 domain-containing protein [Pseudomonas berkeleyensis]WSO40505.1 DUF4124 domain-containing protein [Pseudomonas berkeleyensis]
MRRLLLIATLLPALATAEIYRWTDEQGRVHFGQRPVAGAEPVEVRPQVVERDEHTREREARTQRFHDARREEQQQAAATAAAQRAERASECQDLRRRLAQIPEGFSYYRTDANGERIYYSDEETDTARRQLRERIAQRCT